MVKIISFFTVLILFSQTLPVYSDVVRLKEGSVLIGKLITPNKSSIVFANAYGTFRIRRIHILHIHKTVDYREDIAILEKLGMKGNKEGIIRHIEAGLKKREELLKISSKKSDDIWTNGIVSVSGSYNYVLSEVNDHVPYGFSSYIAFDQGINIFSGKINKLIPGARFEAGYMFFSHGSNKISGYQAGVGFIWAIPSISDRRGYFVMAAVPGISFLDIENSDIGESSTSNTFTGTAITGYRFPLGNLTLFAHIRYVYIYDKSVPFHTIGGEIGLGYNLW